MRNVWKLLPVVLVCVFLVTGCGKGQATPKATIQKMADAMKSGDRAAFIECFDATDERKPLLNATADMIFETKKLDDACTSKFGDSWDMSGRGPGSNPFKNLNADDAEITIDGDKATAKFKDGPGTMPMMKVGGVWKITTDDMPTGEDRDQAVQMMTAMAEVMKAVRADVEAGKVTTADDVKKALSARMMQAMMQGRDMEEETED